MSSAAPALVSFFICLLYLQGCSNEKKEEGGLLEGDDDVDHVFAFSLNDIAESDAEGFPLPLDTCFYDVTLPALLQQGLTQYSWLPHSKIPEEKKEFAPSGAYVYKKGDGSHMYKAIAAVPVDDADAVLKFGKAVEWSSDATFEVVKTSDESDAKVEELKKAILCFEADISLTAEPFNSYKKFVWASGPFAPQGCGVFVYEKNDGGIVYHGC